METLNRDQNHVTVGGGISSVDGVSTLMFKVDPITNYPLVVIGSDSITATAATSDKRDQNYTPTMYGISSVDGKTLVPIRTTSNGTILVDVILM